MVAKRLLLRVVFVSLGLAAVFGAAGVIFAGHDTLWRIVGTCGVTAFGALGLLGATQLVDTPTTRNAGLAVVALVATEYLLGLGLIWGLFPDDAAPRIGISMTILAVTGGMSTVFLVMAGAARTAVAGKIGLAVAIASFVVYEAATWAETLWNGRADRWLELGNSLGGFGLLAAFCLVGAGTDRRHWRWVGVAASAVALLMSVYGIVFDIREPSAIFTCIVCVACVAVHANLLVLCPLTPGQRWLLRATVGAGIATGFLVGFGSLTAPWQEEPLGRLAGAAAIIAGCGTLALMVLARINAGREAAATGTPEPTEVTLHCPRCRTLQTNPIGVASCRACGLRIEVRVGPEDRPLSG